MVSFPGVVDDIDEKIVCPVCGGTRLREETKCFRIDGEIMEDPRTGKPLCLSYDLLREE